MARATETSRRRQLTRAARQVVLERGAVGVRVKDVSERSGLSPSHVLYYYPELDDLLLEVSRDAMERYAEGRADAVRRVEDPVAQLRLAIHLGVPTGPDDEDSRLLYELDAFTGTSTAFQVISTSFYDRQVALYESVLLSGVSRGQFALAGEPLAIARGFVGLEDGLGLQVVIGHPAVDRAEAERILLGYGSSATGVDLGAVPPPLDDG